MIKVEEIEAAERRPDLFLGGKGDAISVHRSGNILDLVLTKIQEIEREPIANLHLDRLRDTYSSRG